MAALAEATTAGTSEGTQIQLPTPSGERWFEISVARKETAPGEALRFIVLARDITERKQAQEAVERLAFYDALTGMPNRRLLLDQLQRAVTASARSGSHGAVLFTDLDDFKSLNDIRGHDAGDLLLQEAAQRLRSAVRSEDTVARLGGDEFVVMVEGLDHDSARAAAQAAVVGDQIIQSLGRAYVLDGGYEHRCTCSVGVSLFGASTPDVGELLRSADTAMYSAKKAGRNTLMFFDSAMQSALAARTRLHGDLSVALQCEQFELHYQAQFDDARRLVGAELLLRWQHPQRGWMVPAQFIQQAEDSSLIVPIGRWVLEQACVQITRWQDDPLTGSLRLSLNLGARQFRHPDFVEQVRVLMQVTGVDPRKLVLEVSESLVLGSTQAVVDTMHSLKAIGVGLSIHDFGSGVSSLSLLPRLPLAQVKIDATVVRDIVTDASRGVIAKTIIGIGRDLGLDVVAMGVETDAQRQRLLDYGCRMFQGHLFSRPLPLSEFEGMLRADPA